MSGAALSPELRSAVWQGAGARCESCLLHEDDAVLPHEPDHIIATQHGGESVAENLALSCWGCNHVKGPNLSSVDPLTHEIVSLFHPRLDRWAEHFRLDGPRIAGLTPRGRVTVFPLQLNAPERVRQGLHLQALGRYPV
ncbi:MAG: HNH endonuclease [Verrucomicrobia bacterium]|nr:MAG: HNH endonuclease [Verrucomicrobiota bacterium]